MSRIILWPYKMGSQGCKALATSLKEEGERVLRVYADRGFRPRPTDLIINWGNGGTADWFATTRARDIHIQNVSAAVHIAANKLLTFNKFEEASVQYPKCFTSLEDVLHFMDEHVGCRIYCRTKLTAKGGEGIEIATTSSDLVPAPLYTVGINVRREYRVHVFNGEVIDVVQKRRRINAETGEPDVTCEDIRNHSNGWVFCRNGFGIPDGVVEQGIKAVAALGLVFGAADVVVERETNKAFVLEVNTAPGLEGTTVEKYRDAILKLKNEREI